MESIRIAWFNWRCIKNPEAGGAEVFTHEVARRLVKMGYDISLVTSQPGNLPSEEVIEGYRVLRSGNKYTVYLKAKKIYETFLEDDVDLVIDEINTVPFFTVMYVKEPVVVLIHQLAREFWLYELKPPISWIGYAIEPHYLKLYRDRPAITVSNSTKSDLKALGFRKIFIVPEGLSLEPLDKLPEKEKEPTIVFLGRLKKVKRPDHAIKAFIYVKKEIPRSKLWIVGDGPLKPSLKKLIEKMGLEEDVIFYGRVNEREKIELLRRAHVLVFPGIREGWGLVITEANSQGTPAVAYDVPGLRDSVRHMKTGILVPRDDIKALANSLILILENEDLRKKLSINALNWAKNFSWDRTAIEFSKVLKQVAH